MGKVGASYEKRFYYWQEVRKQEKKSAALCHFCTNKCCCLLEDSLKDNTWCPVFQPKSNTFYSTNKWKVYSKQKPLRVLKVLQALLSMHAEAVALCLENEKPIVETTGVCPECHIRLLVGIGKPYCSRCGTRWEVAGLVQVTTTYHSPITREMVNCKASLARSVERVTRDVAAEFLRDGKENMPTVQKETSEKKRGKRP